MCDKSIVMGMMAYGCRNICMHIYVYMYVCIYMCVDIYIYISIDVGINELTIILIIKMMIIRSKISIKICSPLYLIINQYPNEVSSYLYLKTGSIRFPC